MNGNGTSIPGDELFLLPEEHHYHQVTFTTNNGSNITQCTMHFMNSTHDPITSQIYFRVVYGTLLAAVFIVALCGGSFTCYVIYKHKMTKKMWAYLLALTISDTATCVWQIPMLLAACIDERILEHRSTCVLSGAVMIFFTLMSIYTLTGLSIHRYHTIAHPLQSHTNLSNRPLFIGILLSTLCAGILSFAPAFGFSAWTYLPGRKWCVTMSCDARRDTVYVSAMVLGGHLIPISVIAATFFGIYCALKKHNKQNSRLTRTLTAQKMERGNRVMTKTTTLVIGSFFVLYTPAALYYILGRVLKVPLVFGHVVYIVLQLQGTTNTLIYCFRHKVFKQELAVLFGRDTTKHNYANVNTTASMKRNVNVNGCSVKSRSTTSV